MRINKIKAKSIDGINEFELDLAPVRNKFAFIDPALGQTYAKILKLALGEFVSGVDTNVEFRPKKEKYFGAPQHMEVSGTLYGRDFAWSLSVKPNGKMNKKELSSFHKMIGDMHKLERESVSNLDFPVVAFFDKGVLSEVSGKDSGLFGTYAMCSRFGAYNPKLSESIGSWLKWHGEIRVQNAIRHGAPINPYLDLFERVMSQMFTNIHNPTYDILLGDTMFVTEQGDLKRISELDRAQRESFWFVADLVMRCALLNPHLVENANMSHGVVCVEGNFFHTEGFMKRLEQAFPNIQFIYLLN